MSLHERITELKNRVMEVDVSAPGMNAVTDIIKELLQIVHLHDAALFRIEKSAKSAANVASCLANGIKPD